MLAAFSKTRRSFIVVGRRLPYFDRLRQSGVATGFRTSCWKGLGIHQQTTASERADIVHGANYADPDFFWLEKERLGTQLGAASPTNHDIHDKACRCGRAHGKGRLQSSPGLQKPGGP